MADGTDSDKFVERTQVRRGLKREFNFASSQACSLGRTRVRKAQNESPVSVNRKRLKKATKTEAQEAASGGEKVKDVEELVEAVSEDDAKSDVVDLMSDEEPRSHVAESKAAAGDELNKGVVEMPADNVGSIGDGDEAEMEELKKTEPEKLDLVGGEVIAVEKPIMMYSRSASRRRSPVAEAKLTEKVGEDEMKSVAVDVVAENEGNAGCGGDSVNEDEPKQEKLKKSESEQTLVEMDILNQGDMVECEVSEERDTRSELEVDEDQVVEDEMKNGVEDMVIDDAPITGGVDESVTGDEPKQEELKESESEQPLRKLDILNLSKKGDKVESEVSEKPQRRFTRAALNVEDEALDFNTVSEESSSVEAEMKMPKTVKKFKLSELLKTGILEGQPVTYCKVSKGRRKAAEKGLTGVISGSLILCHCERCNGTEAVSPNDFELHAKSTNKRPPDYIYLENGKTLRDVLTACNSSLETLEESVCLAVGCSSINTCIICLNCKGSICKGDSKSALLLCGHCLELKETNANISVAGKPSDARNDCSELPKLVSVATSPDTVTKCPDAVPECPDTMPVSPGNVSKFRGTISNCPDSSSKCPDTVLKIRSSASKSRGRVTKKDIGMHKLVFEDDNLPDGSEVTYIHNKEKRVGGYKKGSGIVCNCCNKEVSPSQFESHAGCASRQPKKVCVPTSLNNHLKRLSYYVLTGLALTNSSCHMTYQIMKTTVGWALFGYHNIFLSNGVSLHEFSLELARQRNLSTEDCDDLCQTCKKGGKVIRCNSCPRVYHAGCLPTVPNGTWYCKLCQSMFDGKKDLENNANAIAAGRVAGVDPIKQITNRCIRIVPACDEKFGGCSLCSGHEFKNEGFGPGTVILCDQCEMEFHVGCLKENGIVDLKEVPKEKWFCHPNCLKIYSGLQKLVAHGQQKLPESLLNVVRKKHNEKGPADGSLDIKWRVLSGKTSTGDESSQLLSKALAIFHDQFAPIVDKESGLDFIKEMLYGGAIKTQEFAGMYCAILTVNESLVSAAMFRIYGTDVAELPLVATSADYQGQGYFQTLFSCIERFLAYLSVKILLLPAADEAASIWTKKFGFQSLDQSEIHEYRKRYPILIFHGTSVLKKSVPKCRYVGSQESKKEKAKAESS
ncbi:uncharacterized protein LOC126787307 [Argentina anserina]|uniref:uncharacterized protein LOC126787307 n=1 Tax=Argentina anserina TaxID=57926 RepID=UPI0021766628|nr:uncharacterized protein LOC126787307 [Potentilla anserina]